MSTPETAQTAVLREVATETNARTRLRAAKAWIFDMDGVLYRGAEPLPGVADLLAALELRERRYMLATNNSMSTAEEYVKKLATMDVHVGAHAILTSAMATRSYLLREIGNSPTLAVIGMPALEEQLYRGTEFRRVLSPDQIPDAVVVGLDKLFTYDKLAQANAWIRAGARFIATNADATLPTEAGLIPGAGSIVAAIRTASGVAPVIIGKPEPLMLQMALADMGIEPAEAVMVGDRLDTDVIAGERAGMSTTLVLTGVSTRQELPQAPVLPDLVFTDLTAILDALVADK